MTNAWTRNQKLTLGGIVVAVIGIITSLIVKINIDLHYLKNEVSSIKADSAKIENLESEFASIKKVVSESIQANNIGTGQCPKGFSSALVFDSDNSTAIKCIPIPNN